MESLLPIIVFIIFMALQALASRKPKKTFPEQELPDQADREVSPDEALQELRDLLFGDQTPKPQPAPPPPPPLPRPAPIKKSLPPARTAIAGSIPKSRPFPARPEAKPYQETPVEILEPEAQPDAHPMLKRLQNPETVRDVVVMSEILQRRRPV